MGTVAHLQLPQYLHHPLPALLGRHAERLERQAAAGEALLQVEGLDHDWDRLIHKVKVEKSARDSRYSTELNGSKYVILIVRDGWGELYLPGEQQTRQVAYSESLSSAGEPQAFLTDYLEQK